MSDSAVILIPGPPIPWKAPYVGKRGAYSPNTATMMQLRAYVKSIYTGPFFTDAINFVVQFYLKIPKGTSKKRRLLMLSGVIRPTIRIDRTNCCKFYEDLLQGICYKDDCIIVGGEPSKWYAEEPKTEISIFEA